MKYFLAILSCLIPALANAQPMASHLVNQFISTPNSAHALDVDLDGDMDVAGVMGQIHSDVLWFENYDGSGTAWVRHVATQDMAYPRAMEVLDVDEDGDDDLIVVDYNRGVFWLENDNAGSNWIEHNIMGTQLEYTSVELADFNDDGYQDLLLFEAGGLYGRLTVAVNRYVQSGMWIYRALEYNRADIASAYPADVDVDGDLDVVIAVTGNPGAAVRWYENVDGDASDWEESLLVTPENPPLKAYSIDANGDGCDDLLIREGNEDISFDRIWFNDGTGVFTDFTEIFSEVQVVDFASRDVDQDGDLDMYTASGSGVVLWKNVDGSGMTWDPQFLTPDSPTNSFEFADFDGDEVLDLVKASNVVSAAFSCWKDGGNPDTWDQFFIHGNNEAAMAVESADIDGDGDMDMCGSGSLYNIVWWDDVYNDGSVIVARTITGDFYRAVDLRSGDLDEDGDPDLVAVSRTEGRVAWWENVANGLEWIEHQIDNGISGSTMIQIVDVFNTGHLDVMISREDRFCLWENVDGSGLTWDYSEYVVEDGEISQFKLADVDSDGDLDLFVSGTWPIIITWIENVNGTFQTTDNFRIEGSFYQPRGIDAADIDNDGDIDVAGTAYAGDEVRWWENIDGYGTEWASHTINGIFNDPYSITLLDFDNDNDLDFLICENLQIILAENLDGHGTQIAIEWLLTQRIYDCCYSDLNGDTFPDIFITSLSAYWWENLFVSVPEPSPLTVDEPSLMRVYPNPFNSETTITYTLSRPSNLQVTVFNSLGQKQAELTNHDVAQGTHTVTLNAHDWASGVYYISIQVNDVQEAVNRIVLLK